MNDRQYDVLAIGNAIVDIVRRCDAAFLGTLGIQPGIMNPISDPERIKSICRDLKPGIEVAGGTAANTAVGIVSLGGSAAFVGSVADDCYGRTFMHDIHSVGVTFDATPTVVPEKATSHSLILVTPDGKRTMLTHLGCSPEIDKKTITAELVASARYLYLEGYLFDREASTAALHHATQLAGQNHTTVALSLSDPSCTMRHRNELLELLDLGVGIVFANEAELIALYGTQSANEALAEAAKAVPITVMTMSERGAIVVANGDRVVIPPERVSKVVDATGAGDMFASGFLYGLTHGLDIAAAGRLATVCATDIVGTLGARPEGNLGQMVRMRGLI